MHNLPQAENTTNKSFFRAFKRLDYELEIFKFQPDNNPSEYYIVRYLASDIMVLDLVGRTTGSVDAQCPNSISWSCSPPTAEYSLV